MTAFGSGMGKVYKRQGNMIFVEIPQKDLGKTIIRLRAKEIEHISAITGYDNGKQIELIYHFVHGKNIINIKLKIDRNKPVIDSIMKQFPGAELYERECYEMFGVKFQGNPSMKRMLLGHTSPVTPLRKDAKLEREGVDKGGKHEKKK
jgi:NADH-quinone oxidoreductase subunit C